MISEAFVTTWEIGKGNKLITQLSPFISKCFRVNKSFQDNTAFRFVIDRQVTYQ